MQVLRQTNDEIRRTPGTTLTNSKTGETIYTPPSGENIIREKLSNWEKFINNTVDLDPLIILSLMHYQFEAIHPFSDGNGRTGRILNILYLLQEELLDIPVLFLSRYINTTKSKYYTKLLNVTLKEEWEEWILYMLSCIYETSLWTKNKIISIKELFDKTREKVQKELPKIYSMELLEVLFEQPYCRIHNLKEANIAKRQTGSVYLKELVKIGILEERKVGRDNIYINKELYKLLTQTKRIEYKK
jgi:Fic family protein